MEDDELEHAIYRAWIALKESLSREGKIAASQTLAFLVKQRGTAQITRMEVEKGLR